MNATLSVPVAEDEDVRIAFIKADFEDFIKRAPQEIKDQGIARWRTKYLMYRDALSIMTVRAALV